MKNHESTGILAPEADSRRGCFLSSSSEHTVSGPLFFRVVERKPAKATGK